MNPATHKECPDCGKLVPLDRLAAHALKCWTPLQGVTNADSPQSTRADHPLAGRPVVATPTHEPELTALRAELEATRDQAADLTTQRDTARRDADHNLRDLLELRRKVEAEEDAREHQRRAILKAKPLDPLELGQLTNYVIRSILDAQMDTADARTILFAIQTATSQLRRTSPPEPKPTAPTPPPRKQPNRRATLPPDAPPVKPTTHSTTQKPARRRRAPTSKQTR